MGRKQPKTEKPPAKSKCRNCGMEAEIPRYEFFKANKPRCGACGGLLDYQGSWRKTR